MYIIYVNNTLPLAHEISRHFWAAYAETSKLNILTQICAIGRDSKRYKSNYPRELTKRPLLKIFGDR